MDQTPSMSKWLPAVVAAWIIPGGGHFLLKRPGRGGLIAASVTAMFLLGLMMRGALFSPQTGDLLTTVIYVGGFIGNLMSQREDRYIARRYNRSDHTIGYATRPSAITKYCAFVVPTFFQPCRSFDAA